MTLTQIKSPDHVYLNEIIVKESNHHIKLSRVCKSESHWNYSVFMVEHTQLFYNTPSRIQSCQIHVVLVTLSFYSRLIFIDGVVCFCHMISGCVGLLQRAGKAERNSSRWHDDRKAADEETINTTRK